MLIYQVIIVMPKSIWDAKQSGMPLAVTKKQEYDVGIFNNRGGGHLFPHFSSKNAHQKLWFFVKTKNVYDGLNCKIYHIFCVQVVPKNIWEGGIASLMLCDTGYHHNTG